MQCELQYIPERLKTLDKPIVNIFSIGELLYYRCKRDDLDNPYKGLSIAELSHNRSGIDNNISELEDVLYNIVPEKGVEKFDLEVCILKIVDLTNDNKYHKEFPEEPHEKITSKATMDLLHEPEPCMYPHCVFRVHLNGEKITRDNYKTTLNKSPEIQSMIKQELAKMILRQEISQK